MSRADAYRKLVRDRKQLKPPAVEEAIGEKTTSTESAASESAASYQVPKKRGRPATGKRSNASWIGRTYYVRREVDLNVEEELFQLKRQGIEVDKSELVDFLLETWVKFRKGDISKFPNGGIPPIQK